ncbi:hypothetical protein B0T26DRAFT_353839 [Lasiosphaeria miniovina]|uniref:Secreted protein n=1 Tax=Lasiosphaeria miniovina TaxID=1954250 RepID=A0AA40DVA2_9PEZI|nr:uncharacterized protein B0T26DRAFT_353839 [Lasiosphaeria miniovina]KAK0713058.1 hypothetical protein B0T26DRAFT_353839 [Lasiosphaeria miniovina]
MNGLVAMTAVTTMLLAASECSGGRRAVVPRWLRSLAAPISALSPFGWFVKSETTKKSQHNLFLIGQFNNKSSTLYLLFNHAHPAIAGARCPRPLISSSPRPPSAPWPNLPLLLSFLVVCGPPTKIPSTDTFNRFLHVCFLARECCPVRPSCVAKVDVVVELRLPAQPRPVSMVRQRIL